MNPSEQYPELDCVLTLYFGQDWDEDYEDLDAALKAAMTVQSRKSLAQALSELDDLSGRSLSEQELKLTLYDLGFCVLLEAFGLTYAHWLQALRAAIVDALKT